MPWLEQGALSWGRGALQGCHPSVSMCEGFPPPCTPTSPATLLPTLGVLRGCNPSLVCHIKQAEAGSDIVTAERWHLLTLELDRTHVLQLFAQEITWIFYVMSVVGVVGIFMHLGGGRG